MLKKKKKEECTMVMDISADFNILTCVVDKDVQSGFSRQEGLSKAANWLEARQIQLHENHLIVPTLLKDINAG